MGDAAQAVGRRPCAQAQARRFGQARAGQIERADLAQQVEAVGRQPACLSGRIERTHQGPEGLGQIPGPGVGPQRLPARPATAARRKAFPAAWRPINQRTGQAIAVGLEQDRGVGDAAHGFPSVLACITAHGVGPERHSHTARSWSRWPSGSNSAGSSTACPLCRTIVTA